MIAYRLGPYGRASQEKKKGARANHYWASEDLARIMFPSLGEVGVRCDASVKQSTNAPSTESIETPYGRSFLRKGVSLSQVGSILNLKDLKVRVLSFE